MRLIPTRDRERGSTDRNKPSITADTLAGHIKYKNEEDLYRFDDKKDTTKCIQHISVVDYAKNDGKIQMEAKPLKN